ncbi:hypothetical protein IFVP136_C230410 [Vibrio parahaemolyticus]
MMSFLNIINFTCTTDRSILDVRFGNTAKQKQQFIFELINQGAFYGTTN